MTIKELKEKIKDLPDTMDVMLEQTNDEFKYSLLELVEIKEVAFDDPFNENTWGMEECLILSDES